MSSQPLRGLRGLSSLRNSHHVVDKNQKTGYEYVHAELKRKGARSQDRHSDTESLVVCFNEWGTTKNGTAGGTGKAGVQPQPKKESQAKQPLKSILKKTSAFQVPKPTTRGTANTGTARAVVGRTDQSGKSSSKPGRRNGSQSHDRA